MEKDFLIALLEAANRIAYQIFEFIKNRCS